MTILQEIAFPGVTALQYEEANQRAGVGADSPPAGLLAHTAVIDEHGLRMVNVWESTEAMETFVEVITPAAEEAGFPKSEGPPTVSEAYNFIAPK
ncbi:MAG: hypothetical protein QOF84_4743 [Streptomyces sp.]|jgi:hypothetical protein|nr:hypothetical protein [Streptomyces sp.]MDX6349953.1 hypothetical protein [Streptomyces sp.]